MINEIKKTIELTDFPKDEGIYATISGRIVFLRDLGKLLFIKISDIHRIVQISLNEEHCEEFATNKSKLKLGDIITVYGFTYKTVAGEITLQVQKLQIDVVPLKQLPDKWHGLKDEDLKQRYRYLDLIRSQQTREVFITRNKIIHNLRKFLYYSGFIEVETPILQPIPSGAAATPFKTHHNALNIPLYLRIAPEFYLKRLLVAGYNKVFELGKCFRNEGMDPTHLQEFTMLETYETYQSYEGLMDYAIRMLQTITSGLDNNYRFENIKRISYYEFLETYGNLDSLRIHDENYLISIARENKLDYKKHKTRQGLIDFIYKKLCVSKISDPLLVYDYPKHPLAKPHPTDPYLSQKIQIIFERQEIVNAYMEQNDPIVLEEGFKLQEAYKKEGEEEVFETDNDFVEALKYGMPPAAGFGMGIDRLVKILTDCDSIRDTVFFPTMK